MSHLYFEQSSFDRDIKELKDNFNYAVNEKVSYLAAVTNFHGYSHSDLLSFLQMNYPNIWMHYITLMPMEFPHCITWQD